MFFALSVFFLVWRSKALPSGREALSNENELCWARGSSQRSSDPLKCERHQRLEEELFAIDRASPRGRSPADPSRTRRSLIVCQGAPPPSRVWGPAPGNFVRLKGSGTMDSATDPYFSAQPAGMDLDGGMAPAPLSFTEVKP